jgi:hypothetical protein
MTGLFATTAVPAQANRGCSIHPNLFPRFDPLGPQVPPTTRRRQRSVAGARRRVAGPSYGLPGQTGSTTEWSQVEIALSHCLTQQVGISARTSNREERLDGKHFV